MSEQIDPLKLAVRRLEIPIRVIGFALERNQFSEDTKTITVRREGASIKLKEKVYPRTEVRIINLESYKEADFRIVSPTRMDGREPAEWGVEYLEAGRNIWGQEFPRPANLDDATTVAIECRACHKKSNENVSPIALEALNASGILAFQCDQCKKLTYWSYADLTRYPMKPPPADLVAPPMPAKRVEPKGIEKRKSKRMGMRLPILVRNTQGTEETTKTDDVSKGGVAVSLSMDLSVGDQVTVVCPYSPGQTVAGFGQKAEVRRRGAFTFNDRRQYGLKYLS